MNIQIISFGFKYGQPVDAQLQFDVRCLPNPYYIEELRPLSGLDSPVYDYVMDHGDSRDYLAAMTQVAALTARLRQSQGKDEDLVVYVGCTGGRHRSVSLARALYGELTRMGWSCELLHRELTEGGR